MERPRYQLKSLEKFRKVWKSAADGCCHVAQSIALSIRQNSRKAKKKFYLATGSSPIQVYQELVRMHREEGLAFGMWSPSTWMSTTPATRCPQSYVRFMHEYLFDHVDIKPENIHIPDGTIPMEKVELLCGLREGDRRPGGLDIQLLGISADLTTLVSTNRVPGSIPKPAWSASTPSPAKMHLRISHEDDVPYRAITMGIKSIMNTKTIYLLVPGATTKLLSQTSHRRRGDGISALHFSSQKHPNVKAYLIRAPPVN